MNEIRVGDVVLVTARVTRIRSGGGFDIEPVGFDYDVTRYPGSDSTDVDHFTVDPPMAFVRTWRRNDSATDLSGPGHVVHYHEDLGDGLHLVRSASGWRVVPRSYLDTLVRPEPA